MHFAVIGRITGILLMLFSVTMLTPIAVALLYGETTIPVFLLAFLLTLGAGFVMWAPSQGTRELRSRDGFMVTTLFYAGLGTFGALPLYLAGDLVPGFTDAMFESLSGLTTTGATVITGLDDAPRSLLFYRQQLQWLGGMGIIVLAVAVLPMLGIGGMQLYRAESPGPVKDTKLTPRITETAKALWYIYLSLTIACASAYWIAGMSLFDALSHAFATVAIGGFSTHDASMGWFNNPMIETIAMIFMIISAVNFGLHFAVTQRRAPGLYFRDTEVRFFLSLLGCVAFVVCLTLMTSHHADTPLRGLREGLFQVVSVATTTGFTTTNFGEWPVFVQFALLFVAFVGGCAGSTAGGIKCIRVVLVYLQGLRELRRLIHPNAVFVVKVGRRPVSDRVVEAVWAFCSVYAIVFLGVLLILLAQGLDFVTAFSATGACINNLGPGLGEVAVNYQSLGDGSKWILMFAMMLGRLEIFTLLVLFTPMYWRT